MTNTKAAPAVMAWPVEGAPLLLAKAKWAQAGEAKKAAVVAVAAGMGGRAVVWPVVDAAAR